MMNSIVSEDYQGFRDIKTEINKWGENLDIDTADATLGQVIWPVKASVQQYIFIDTAIPLFLNSNSANDTALGTGARSVSGMYQTDDESKSFELDLAGLSNVPLPENSVGVFRFSVLTSGSLNKNEGQLRIVDGSNNIYATVEAGEGQTQIAVFRVPTGFSKGVVIFHKTDFARSGPTGTADMRLRIRRTDGTIVTKWDPGLTTSNTFDEKTYSKYGGITVNPGEWVYWECIDASANNTPVRGSFDIQLIGG